MGAKLKCSKFYVLFRMRLEISIDLEFVQKYEINMDVWNVRKTTKRIKIQCVISEVEGTGEEIQNLNIDTYSWSECKNHKLKKCTSISWQKLTPDGIGSSSVKILALSVTYSFTEKQNLSKYPKQNVNIHLHLAMRCYCIICSTFLYFKLPFQLKFFKKEGDTNPKGFPVCLNDQRWREQPASVSSPMLCKDRAQWEASRCWREGRGLKGRAHWCWTPRLCPHPVLVFASDCFYVVLSTTAGAHRTQSHPVPQSLPQVPADGIQGPPRAQAGAANSLGGKNLLVWIKMGSEKAIYTTPTFT